MNNMIEGLGTTVIGLVIVLMGLAIIMLLVSLFKFMPQKQAEKLKLGQPQPKEYEAPEEIGPTDDLELVAVITAAICASLGTTSDGFVVRSIRRVGLWNDTTKKEQQRRLY